MTAPTSRSAAPPTWRVFVAFGVMLALAVALVVVSRPGAGEQPVGLAPLAPADSNPPARTPAPAATDRLLEDAASAMAAWGLFAATGDLEAVSATFAEGPQLEQLRAEAAERSANGPGLPAFEFALSESDVVTADGQTAVIRSTIEMSRPGTEPAEFRWDIEMRWDTEAGRWLLYTVSTVEE